MVRHDVAGSPVSFAVNVARLPRKGVAVVVDADPAQRERLAALHGLLSVDSYRADLVVTPWKRNGIKVSGRVTARIVQACVVTLDPIEAEIDEAVEGLFLPEGSKLGRQGFELGGEILLDAEGPDAPELFSGDTIDAGALAEEYFGLAIDPYPRSANAGSPDAGGPGAGVSEGTLRDKLAGLSRKS